MELVVLLGVHRLREFRWRRCPTRSGMKTRRRYPGSSCGNDVARLRQELKRLIPELDLDPLPTDPKGRAYRLDPRVIASDVHQFVELAAWAKSLPRSDAIRGV